MCECVLIYMKWFLALSTRGSRCSDTSAAMSTPIIHILFPKHYSSLRGSISPEKWLISEVEQRKYEMNLKHLVAPNKEVLKNLKIKKNGRCQKDRGASLKEPPLVKVVFVWASKLTNIVLSYNQKNKINTLESMLI